MESSSQSQPVAKEHSDGSDKDRITNLPNQLRHHILSFLRTRDVVRTSILSKRWRYLWASMKYLDFYDEDLEEGQMTFNHFVNTVLLVRDRSDVHSFHLRCHNEDVKRSHLSTWIHYAVKHNVNELSFIVGSNTKDVDLPNCLFTCQSLEKINLIFDFRVNIHINSTMVIELGRLKSLGLSYINHDGLLDKIIAGCPILEELRLFQCSFMNLDISSLTLKSLRIEECSVSGPIIRISIPSLIYLYFLKNVFDMRHTPEILLENLSSLHSAFIQTDDYPGDVWDHAYDTKPLKFITLSSKGITNEPLEFLSFHNLKRLMLSACRMTENIQAVAHFLQRAPNLETLTLENPADSEASKRSTKLSFDCEHLKMLFQVKCDTEDDIIKLLSEIVGSKCECPSDSE